MEIESPRLPTQAERGVMQLLVTPTYGGVEAFREQIVEPLVQTNCTCGCGSFSIIPDAAAPIAAEHDYLTPTAWNGEDAIDIFLFAVDGRLTGAEITYYKDESRGVPVDLSKFNFE